MEEKMETTTMGDIGTAIQIHSLQVEYKPLDSCRPPVVV